MLSFVLQMHWDFDMYIRNRVDTSPSPVAWSSMCKQLFGFIGFMLVMFYLGQKFRVYQPVVSTNQLFLFICLFTFFLSFLQMWCKPLSSVCFTVKHVWQWNYLWWHQYILKVQCVFDDPQVPLLSIIWLVPARPAQLYQLSQTASTRNLLSFHRPICLRAWPFYSIKKVVINSLNLLMLLRRAKCMKQQRTEYNNITHLPH